MLIRKLRTELFAFLAPRVQSGTLPEEDASDAEIPDPVPENSEETGGWVKYVDMALDVGEGTTGRKLGSILSVAVDGHKHSTITVSIRSKKRERAESRGRQLSSGRVDADLLVSTLVKII